MLHQHLNIFENKHTQNKTKINKNSLQVQKIGVPRWISFAREFMTSSMWTTFAWSSLICAPFEVPKERKKAPLTLAPSRGTPEVTRTYLGTVVVLSQTSTHRNKQTSTQARACHVILTRAHGSTQTHVHPVRV